VSGLLIHADTLAGVDDVDRQTLTVERVREPAAENVLGSYQMHSYRELAAGENRSTQFGLRRLVRAHGIESDVSQHRPRLAGFLDFNNVTALVDAALGACTVGQLALVAVGALGETDRGQRIVRTALGGAGLRVAPLWIRHF
jgi:hypothetical protein